MSQLTISVITPSFNQAAFLPDCLESVESQTVKPVEHLVFDPGSTDGSRDIAKRFAGVTLVEEPDEGQSEAVNKGLNRAKGDIIAWINSDDEYARETVFEEALSRFEQEDAPDIVYGRGVYLDGNGDKLRDAYVNANPASLGERLQHEVGLMQPAMFFRRSVADRVGNLRVDRHYTLDYEYWIRCVKEEMRFAFVDSVFARARYHEANKTFGSRGESYLEICSVVKEHFGYVHSNWLQRYAEYLSDGHDGVVKTGGNSGLRSQAEFEKSYKRLLAAYNGVYDTFTQLEKDTAGVGEQATLAEMKRLEVGLQTPCYPIALNQDWVSGQTCYTVADRRWAFDAAWKDAEIQKSHKFLRSEIGKREKEVCVIVGNGPSLNREDLTLLEGEDVIVSNNAFLSDALFRYAKYYTVVNYKVAEQSSARINQLRGVAKVFPYWLSYCLNACDSTYFMDAIGYPEFSTDMFKNMSWRHTVTFFNMHLAYGLGYQKVVMIGFDHSYTQPEGVKEEEVILDYNKDKNHFIDTYFQGQEWQAADVGMMEAMYRLAKEAFESDGRTIVNATTGGMLNLFERMPLADALGKRGDT